MMDRQQTRRHLSLERLEERSLLAIHTWTGAVDDDFGKAGNWDPAAGAPPAMDDVALFSDVPGVAVESAKLDMNREDLSELRVESGDVQLDLNGHNLGAEDEIKVLARLNVINSKAGDSSILGFGDLLVSSTDAEAILSGKDLSLLASEATSKTTVGVNSEASLILRDGVTADDLGAVVIGEGMIGVGSMRLTDSTVNSVTADARSLRVGANGGQGDLLVDTNATFEVNGDTVQIGGPETLTEFASVGQLTVKGKFDTKGNDLEVGNEGDTLSHSILDVDGGGELISGETTIHGQAFAFVQNVSTWTVLGSFEIRGDMEVSGLSELKTEDFNSFIFGGKERKLILDPVSGEVVGEEVVDRVAKVVIENGSTWDAGDKSVIVGFFEDAGELTIDTASRVLSKDSSVGLGLTTVGKAVVRNGSLWDDSGEITVGTKGSLEVSGVGIVRAEDLTIRGTLRGGSLGKIEATTELFGEFIIGFSPDIFEIDGDYTQESTGTLEIELGGLTVGDDYDQLQITDGNGDLVGGNAMLGGTLDVTLIDAFVDPAAIRAELDALNGAPLEFSILTATAGLSGEFEEIRFNGEVQANSQSWLADGLAWQVVYDRTTADGDGMEVVLEVLPPVEVEVDAVAIESALSSYSPGTDFDFTDQDTNSIAAVVGNGATLQIDGDGWKKISLPYTVTASTVLEFDFALAI